MRRLHHLGFLTPMRSHNLSVTAFIALVATVSAYLPLNLLVPPARQQAIAVGGSSRAIAQTPNTKPDTNPAVKPAVSGSFVDYYPEQTQLKGNEGSVNSANFSPDCKRIVTAGTDGTARVWDFSGVETRHVASLRGHSGSVRSANFSPDGQRIVTASFDGTARVWELSGVEPRAIASLQGHQGYVYSASFSPDGKRIVTAGADGSVRLWDISGKQLAIITDKNGSIYSANLVRMGSALLRQVLIKYRVCGMYLGNC